MSCWSIVPDVMSFLLPAQSHHLAPRGASIVETLRVIKLHMAETLEAFKSVFKRLSFQMRSYFVFALHTGFRRSKQMDLRWLTWIC